MRKFLKLIFSRMSIMGCLILVQLSILIIGIWKLSESFVYMYGFFVLLSIVVVVYIVSRTDNPSYKLAWAILVLLLPVFGGLFYLFFGGNKIGRRLRRQMEDEYYEGKELLRQNEEVMEEVKNQDKRVYNQVKYISDYGSFPIYKNTTTEFLSPGEKFFEKLVEELKGAKHYIFMEYFIIHEGKMWDEVLDVLSKKASEGVDVRLIYDDMGCITTLPNRYYEKMEALGIKTMVFNKLTPILSVTVNNRDHRKITVIDGHTAFTGGINLADEYINHIERFGYWKDASIMLKGEGVWSLSVMFLQVWHYLRGEKEDYNKFKPSVHKKEEFSNDGYVQPYGDSPYDGELVGENVYLNIINKAKEYVYIETPYLIIDNELVTALTLAAKGGVDVRVVTPHIEDKWYAHIVTRAYYSQLIEAGVKIYEFTPGFIHSKIFVADDEIGTVGTINMDYRSLYLHLECGVFLYKTSSIVDIKKDFMDIINVSHEITMEDTQKVKWSNRFIRAILRVFAPLM